jgi:hypothetical protein
MSLFCCCYFRYLYIKMNTVYSKGTIIQNQIFVKNRPTLLCTSTYTHTVLRIRTIFVRIRIRLFKLTRSMKVVYTLFYDTIFCQNITFKPYIYVIKVNQHVFLSTHDTVQHKKGWKYVNFSSLGSGSIRDPDPQHCLTGIVGSYINKSGSVDVKPT